MAEVPVVLRILTQGQPQASASLRTLQGDLGGVLGVLEQGAGFARGFAIALGGLAAGLVGLGGAAVRSAGEFEQLQVKLESVLHSSERAREVFGAAVDLAAKTPFDVKGIVQASVILETFGQRSQEVLPLAANLAAAFGVQVQETGLVLGKAFSGSLEGFESLRNTSGIANVELAKFGAELTNTGGISVQTSGDLEKARTALTKIIQTRFGDAVAKQSQTLFGALSNLGDAVTRLGASFGQALVPIVTSATRTFTALVEAFEGLPRIFRNGIVVAGALGAGLAGVGAAVLAIGAAATSAAVQLGTFAIAMGAVGTSSAAAATSLTTAELGVVGFSRATVLAAGASRALGAVLLTSISPVTAAVALVTTAFVGLGVAIGVPVPALVGIGVVVTGLAVAFTGLGTAIAGATAASFAFLATPLGVALLGLAAAAGAAFAAFQHLEDLKEASKVLDEQSKALQSASQEWRTYRDVVVKATEAQQGFISEGGSVREVAEQLAAAFGKISPADLVNNATKAGVSLASLKKDLAENAGEADNTRQALQALATVTRLLETGTFATPQKADIPAIQQVQQLLKGQAITLDTVGQATKSLGVQQANLAKTRLGLTGLFSAFEQVSPKLDTAAKSAEQFGAFLKFATKSDDVGELNQSLGLTKTRIAEVEAQLKATGLNTSTAALQKRLITAGPDEAKAIEGLLGLREQQQTIEQKITTEQTKSVQERIRNITSQSEREKLLGQENLAGEKQRLQEVLATVKQGSEQEIQILRRIEAIDTETRRNRVQAARNQFAEVVSGAREAVEKVNASGTASAQQQVNAIQGAIGKLEAFRAGNQALLNQNPELRSQFRTTFQGFQKDLDRAKQAVPKERLEELLRTAEKFNEEATSTPQKLAAVGQQIDLLTNALASGQITTTATRTRLQDKINDLKREEHKLTEQTHKEEQKQATETAALRQSGLETELELLKARQAAGANVTATAVKAKEQEILAGKLEAIRAQEQAEIDSGVSIEQARQRTEIRITQLKQQETLKRIQSLQQETQAVQKEADAQKAIKDRLEGLKSQRLGGSASPLISLEELSLQSQLPGFGSGSDRIKFSSGLPGTGGANVRAAEAEVSARFRQAELQGNRALPPFFEPGLTAGTNGAAGAAAAPATANTTVTNNIYVDGAAKGEAQITQAARDLMRAAINEEFRKSRLLKGPASGPLNGSADA